MSTKTLIVSGDSFTVPNMHDIAPKPWASYLAEKAGWNIINAAKGGASNHYIFNSIIDELEKHRGEDVYACVLWSEPLRINLFDSSCVVLNSVKHLLNKAQNHPEEMTYTHREYVKTNHAITRKIVDDMKLRYDENFFEIYDKMINHTLRFFKLFEDYCDHNNIKYSHASCLHPFGDETIFDLLIEPDEDENLASVEFKKGLQRIKKSSYCKQLSDSKNYMGFEFSVSDWIRQTKHYISEFSHHPNDLGHQKVAEIYYDFIFNNKQPSIEQDGFMRPVYIYD
jgi:hypothetical protein